MNNIDQVTILVEIYKIRESNRANDVQRDV